MRNKKFTLWISETQSVYFNNFHQILLLQYSPLPPRRGRLRIPLVARGPWKEILASLAELHTGHLNSVICPSKDPKGVFFENLVAFWTH